MLIVGWHLMVIILIRWTVLLNLMIMKGHLVFHLWINIIKWHLYKDLRVIYRLLGDKIDILILLEMNFNIHMAETNKNYNYTNHHFSNRIIVPELGKVNSHSKKPKYLNHQLSMKDVLRRIWRWFYKNKKLKNYKVIYL